MVIPPFASIALAPTTAMAQSPLEALSQISNSLESIVRSHSEASNRPSMAMIDRETARSMNYDNQLKHVRTYFEKRRLNRQYREMENPRRSGAEITASAKRRAPNRLTSTEYDPYGGRINWPIALRATGYDDQRNELNRLFAAHAAYGGGINTTSYAPIDSLVGEMESRLIKNFKNTNAQQFSYARKFLISLKYEARFPVGS
ncbi:MAG: hypothetical protein AAF539_14110 [Planctomycetota bacterium]